MNNPLAFVSNSEISPLRNRLKPIKCLPVGFPSPNWKSIEMMTKLMIDNYIREDDDCFESHAKHCLSLQCLTNKVVLNTKNEFFSICSEDLQLIVSYRTGKLNWTF
jgi:hypothetical protein